LQKIIRKGKIRKKEEFLNDGAEAIRRGSRNKPEKG